METQRIAMLKPLATHEVSPKRGITLVQTNPNSIFWQLGNISAHKNSSWSLVLVRRRTQADAIFRIIILYYSKHLYA